jgi:hypothetical protein
MPNDPLRDNAPIIATLMSFCMLNRVTLTLILQPSDAVERTLRVKNSLMRYWEMTKALNNDEDCKNVH